jgi:hypothetical protein
MYITIMIVRIRHECKRSNQDNDSFRLISSREGKNQGRKSPKAKEKAFRSQRENFPQLKKNEILQ